MSGHDMGSVVHVTTAHSPRDNRILRKECRTLSESGYRVSLIAPSDRPFDEFGVSSIPIPVREGRIRRMALGPASAYRALWTLSPSVVHVHDPELIPFLFACRLLPSRPRLVFDAHEDLAKQVSSKPYIRRELRSTVSLLARGLTRAVGKIADLVVAATPSIAADFPQSKTVLVQNFPWLEDFPVEAPGPIPEFTLSFVGGLNEVRGGAQLLEALCLADSSPSCVMAGPISPRIKGPAISAPNFRYLGILTAEEVVSVIRDARAGIVCFLPEPNHLASQPTKLFEYMAAGRAVICSDFALWRELLEPFKCAMFVDPLDPVAIANAIDFIARNEDEVMEMGRNARRAFESNYAFENEANTLVFAYERLLARESV